VNETVKLRTFDALLQVGLLAPVVLGSLVVYFGVLSPLRTRAAAVRAQCEQIQNKLQSAPVVRRENQHLKNRLADLQSRAEVVRLRIPDGPEEAEFLHEVHQAAEGAGLRLEDYRRGNVVVGPRHSQLEVHLVGLGNYDSLCRFCQGVDGLRRQTQPKSMLLRANPESGTYRLELTLLLFYRSAGAAS
jgi:Tfp pilus assembly protein PilO